MPLIRFLQRFTGPFFAPSIGLVYILAKALIRYVLHKLADNDYDFWGVLAWFGVDVILLSTSVCIAAKTFDILRLGYYDKALLYVIHVICIFASCALYGFFIKRRKFLRGARPLNDLRLFVYLSVNWLIGILWFWGTIRFLGATPSGG